ncbi:MAG TPA: hypothetical protein G4O11_08330 [Anaerolineae bacterium]|nr:MAG: hypothetical protein AMJ88_16025 [Anaerolineae bacterium SM23_ 63]HEY43971.1 hypothetical protein [Anaerolineae bacterium]
MIGPEFPVEKIPDEELRQLAYEYSEEKVSVIIVLDYPEPKVDVGKIKKGDRVSYVPTSVEPETDEEREEIERREIEMREFLENILDSPPNYLPMARAFVATVTGEQLRIIADLPMTKSIEFNRELR